MKNSRFILKLIKDPFGVETVNIGVGIITEDRRVLSKFVNFNSFNVRGYDLVFKAANDIVKNLRSVSSRVGFVETQKKLIELSKDLQNSIQIEILSTTNADNPDTLLEGTFCSLVPSSTM